MRSADRLARSGSLIPRLFDPGRLLLTASGLGFPLAQIAIRRFGRSGALVVEGVSAGFLIRDAAMIAAGTPRRLRRGPAILLWLEAVTAAVAVLAGLRPVLDANARKQAVEPRPAGWEIVRRAAVGTLFGLHTVRFRTYLQPDHGRPADEVSGRKASSMAQGAGALAAHGISRKERVGLAIHRGLDRWLSPLGVWVMRRTKGGVARPLKVDALLLTTRGRRSGRERTVVLQFFPDGESMLLAAANDGGASHPGWYWNLTAELRARVEVDGRTIPVRAEIIPSADAPAAWERVVHRDPSYERYGRATTRTIPIIRLVPVEPREGEGDDRSPPTIPADA